MTTRGVDIRQASDRILFRASLKDADGLKVVTGTAELRLYRLNDDGTLAVLDWTTYEFVATGTGTPDDETTLTHQLRRDSSGSDVATGIWTAVLDTLTALTTEGIYIAQVTHPGAFPESQEREFQFGGVEGSQADEAGLQSLALAMTQLATDADLTQVMQVTTKLDTLIEEADVGSYQFTEPALRMAPTGAVSGPGADFVTITIVAEGNPVSDADVWITTDAEGTNLIAGTVQTDGNGKFRFLLDHGAQYYLWMQKDGVAPILGQLFTAQRDEA